MARLNPDGLPVVVDTVEVVSPGLVGTVEVHRPGSSGGRGPGGATEPFRQALADTEMSSQLTVEISDHQDVSAAGGSRAGADSAQLAVTVPGPGAGFGQVVLYTAEDGSVSWHFAEGVPPADLAVRGPARLTYRVPRMVVPTDGESGGRGVVSVLGKKVLEVLFFRLVEEAAGRTANWFAARYEQTHRPHRLRTFEPDTYAEAGRAIGAADWGRLTSGRALLFVHGTASSCRSAFGRIPPELMAELYRRYDGRVVGFDHPTISVPPDVNARSFAEQLPEGVRLDLDVVAHSRGGLVGRVMTERAGDVGLRDRVTVGSLVMVATPNAGTPLVDTENLKYLLDRLTNLVQFVPDNGVTDVLDIVLSVVKQVAVGILDGLDGLVAMNPRQAFLTEYLNVADAVTTTAYRAVAADYNPPSGSALLRIARDGVTDLVFGQTGNDLVVPTAGVYDVPSAGTFPVGSPVLFTAADGVDHSTYWAQEPFVTAARDWLTA